MVDFGSRWNDVLRELDLPEEIGQVEDATRSILYGSDGETEAHKALKKLVYDHPEMVGAGSDWERYCEFVTPSLDVIDVLFKSANACIAVEVKAQVSDKYPKDYERGLYQTIKYEALLRAMARCGRKDIPPNVTSVLVVESRLPEEHREKAEMLAVKIYENVGRSYRNG